MDDLTKKKIQCACDSLLETIENPEARLKKANTVERWERKKDDNPYFSHEKQTKRVKKYLKRIRKVYREMRERLKENYKQVRPFSLGAFARAEDPLTADEWAQVVSGVVVTSDFFEALEETVVNEVDVAFKEVYANVVDIHNLGVVENKFVPERVLEEFKTHEWKFSEATTKKIDQSIEDIIFYGVEDGLSNDNITKQIVNKFNQLEKYQAMRISRTETIRASARGTLAAYDELGVKEYEILPAFDACPICLDMETGNPYPIDDSSARPPIHPNCRCTVIPIVK